MPEQYLGPSIGRALPPTNLYTDKQFHDPLYLLFLPPLIHNITMDDREFSRRSAQIDDLPPCLMVDILSRLPIETLATSRLVCKSWPLLFSDPVFVRLHRARSTTCLLSVRSELKSHLKRYKSLGGMAGKDFEVDMNLPMPDADFRFWCHNSCNGLLCLTKGYTYEDVYVCNPILGEYITIPTPSFRRGKCFFPALGFSSSSNQFKVLELHSDRESGDYMAEIYTIGDGTRKWRSIGLAPRYTSLSGCISFLNGSIHWADVGKIGYFDFESDQFGWLPPPPARWYAFSQVGMGVSSDGCLCMYGFDYPELGQIEVLENWVMKEYGVKESWTNICSSRNSKSKGELFYSRDLNYKTTYSPSFISLQDVAESEHLTVLSKTRTKDQDCPEVISNSIFQLWE